MHLDFTHAPYHCNRLYNKLVVTNSHAQNAAFYSLHAWIKGQEITKPHRLQHCCSSFYFPDNIYLVVHCIVSLFCLVRTYIKRLTTTWQQTKGPSSPMLSPTTLVVSFQILKVIRDAISFTEYAKRRSYGCNLRSQALELHSKCFFWWLNLFCFLLLKINRIGGKKVAECSQVERVAREAVLFYLNLISKPG